jgi:hypothetical protein
MNIDVCSIVEGRGEISALPILFRRIRQSVKPDLALNIRPPSRVARNKVVQQGELERAIENVVRRSKSPRILFILLDADDDPPCQFGPELLKRAKTARSDIPIAVVLASREFESWFLSSVDSLHGCCGLEKDIAPIHNTESIRDAKGLLTKLMKGSRAYSPVLDQAALTQMFDMQLARQNSDSFDKCWREIERLLIEGAEQAG